MPKKCLPVLLLAASLFAPLAGASTAPAPKTGGQSVHDSRAARKMTGDLVARARSAHRARGESARVVINLNAGTSAVLARRALEGAGARVLGEFDGLDFVAAEVPFARLAEVAAREEVSWVSPDSEVVSLAAPTDNTSHAAVTTGASKVLPVGNGELAKGGGGNGVGIAVLDSGISPPDAAEFAGYRWTQSGGLLSTGLLSQPVLETYSRVVKRVDFTGEAAAEDRYGHGTHTAGVAAGTGQASENHAA
jgi:hypothetical protein